MMYLFNLDKAPNYLVKYLSYEDVRNLHLVCKELSKKVLPIIQGLPALFTSIEKKFPDRSYKIRCEDDFRVVKKKLYFYLKRFFLANLFTQESLFGKSVTLPTHPFWSFNYSFLPAKELQHKLPIDKRISTLTSIGKMLSLAPAVSTSSIWIENIDPYLDGFIKSACQPGGNLDDGLRYIGAIEGPKTRMEACVKLICALWKNDRRNEALVITKYFKNYSASCRAFVATIQLLADAEYIEGSSLTQKICALFNEVKQPHFEFILSHIIYVLCSSGEIEVASDLAKLLKERSLGEKACFSIVQAYCNQNQVERAIRYVTLLDPKFIPQDNRIYFPIINAYCRMDEWIIASLYAQNLQNSKQKDLFLKRIIEGLCTKRLFNEARALAGIYGENIKDQGIRDEVLLCIIREGGEQIELEQVIALAAKIFYPKCKSAAYSTRIIGYCQRNRLDRVEDFARQITDTASLDSALLLSIASLSKENAVSKIQVLMNLISNQIIKEDAIIYFIEALCRLDKVTNAQPFLWLIKSQQRKDAASVYLAVGWYRQNEVEQAELLIDQMIHQQSKDAACRQIVTTCLHHNQVAKAVEYANKVQSESIKARVTNEIEAFLKNQDVSTSV